MTDLTNKLINKRLKSHFHYKLSVFLDLFFRLSGLALVIFINLFKVFIIKELLLHGLHLCGVASVAESEPGLCWREDLVNDAIFQALVADKPGQESGKHVESLVANEGGLIALDDELG